ncbi:hypothetical protein N0V90_010132 [Kalmusia sp. IMI 367209]|nr:hypothetical protein N0V90_010132 [Kalmusia sp. IMI 367209]
MRILSSALSLFAITPLALASLAAPAHTLDIISPNETTTDSNQPIARGTCSNAIQNPSFETATLASWANYAFGSWQYRGVEQGSSHSGSSHFYAISNGTNQSTTTLAQSNGGVCEGRWGMGEDWE